jgi:hypothetical protein
VSALVLHLAAVEALVARPFPAVPRVVGGDSSGPSHHLVVLRASRDSPQAAARRAFQAELDSLATLLTARWGSSSTVSLAPYLEADGPVAEPFETLRNLAGSVHVWRPPGSGRWLGLALGQADWRLPLELLAAVGVDDL